MTEDLKKFVKPTEDMTWEWVTDSFGNLEKKLIIAPKNVKKDRKSGENE